MKKPVTYGTGFMAAGLALTLGVALIQSDGLADTADVEVDEDLFQQGQSLYAAECAVCHQSDGDGNPPTFPALNNNELLGDLESVVRTIHQGEGGMPAFPDLAADDLAGVATYIRNAWDNDFGGVRVDAVDELLAGLEAREFSLSVRDGVFSEEQVDRGNFNMRAYCAACHGPAGDTVGADPDQPAGPPIVGSRFLSNWEGQSLATLFDFTKGTMPTINPGGLSDRVYIDTIAYMLHASGLPTGDQDLTADPDTLSDILVEMPED